MLFLRLRAPCPPQVDDSWAGIGRVAVRMHRQGYDLQWTQYDERGWRATFYTDRDGALAHGCHCNGMGT